MQVRQLLNSIGTTFNAEEVTARAALYKKSVKTGLRYIMSNGTDKDEYFKVDPTTGKLTCIALPTGTEFTHTVNVVSAVRSRLGY